MYPGNLLSLINSVKSSGTSLSMEMPSSHS
jgi:hypothetical protein